MMNNTGQVVAIWLKRMKRGPMDPVGRAEAVAGRGLVGNANQRGRRQVTIIDADVWDRATDSLGIDVPPSARRANVMVRGIDLANSRGRVLRLGDVRIRIFNETRPCERMDEAAPGLRAALQAPWYGGAFGEVLDDGQINVGDIARWDEADG